MSASTDQLIPRSRLAEAVAELEAAGGTLVGLMAFTAERVRALEPELTASSTSRVQEILLSQPPK